MKFRANFLAVSALAAAISWPAAITAASLAIPFGNLSFEPCTLAAAGQSFTVAARCTTLRVPEDRAHPTGRQIDLAIAWVPSKSKQPMADPVLMLAGGPGQSALEAFPLVAGTFGDVLRRRHVILVDQRGTGGSNALKCPEAFGDETTSAMDFDAAAAKALARACLDELANADPRFYTTSDYIADLEAVRGALQVAQLNLVGVSYGTRVALEYLRRHPGHVRTVLLDSVVPPSLILGSEHARNLEAAIDVQFARCERDATCRARFGSPRDKLDALLARLRQKPATVAYHDPVTDEMREGLLTAEAVAGVVRLHAYAPQMFAMLPMLLAAAAEGRYETLMAQARMAEQLVGEQISIPLQLSVSCAEDAPWLQARPADRDTLIGTAFVDMTHAQCSVWPRGSAPADFHAPVQAPQPVLMLSGELDPVTPPRYGEEVGKTLPQSRHLVLRGQGHSVMGIGCTPKLIGQFIEHADAKQLDASCLDQLMYVPPFAGSYGWEP
jgi:pimeloyl-ACP methyl ester carboxylesterase